MSDYRIEAYKKAVQRITAKWGAEIAKAEKELGAVDEELAELEALEEPTEDDEKKIKALKEKQAALRKRIVNCAMNLKVNLMVITPQPGAPKKELLELPKWLKRIIEEEGIPLGRGVSIAPDVDVDIKSMTLEKFGITITVKW